MVPSWAFMIAPDLSRRGNKLEKVTRRPAHPEKKSAHKKKLRTMTRLQVSPLHRGVRLRLSSRGVPRLLLDTRVVGTLFKLVSDPGRTT